MKRLKYSICLMACCFLLGTTSDAHPFLKRQAYNKTIEKSFPISSDGKLELNNKHGDIDIKLWDKNEVKVVVDIKVDAKSQDKADDVFDWITIETDNGSDFVKVKTEIESSDDSFFSFFGWSFGWSSGTVDFDVNYEVYMPAGLFLDVKNKYGDINCPALKNDAKIDLSYGGLHMERLEGELDLELDYGKAHLDDMNLVTGEVKYSKVQIESAAKIDMETSYSVLEVETVGEMLTESKYDGYKIGKVERFENNGKYDDIRIDHVTDLKLETIYANVIIDDLISTMDIDMKYGNLKVDEVDVNFKDIEVDAKYVDIRLDMNSDSPYDLDFDGEHTLLSLPRLETRKDYRDGVEQEVKGFMNSSGKARIKVNMEFGSFKIED